MDAPFTIDPHDVLAPPTRARLFALLGEFKRPAGTVELAERLELHPKRRARPPRADGASWPRGPSSDPRRARAAPRMDNLRRRPSRPKRPRGYQDPGRWLARALQASPRGVSGIEETGRQIGRELAPRDTNDDGGAFKASLTALGFQPDAQPRKDGVTYCLRNCPYRDAVHEHPPATARYTRE